MPFFVKVGTKNAFCKARSATFADGGAMKGQPISPTALGRLPLYARALREMATRGVEVASSRQLSSVTGLEAHKIRKDLSQLGSLGRRGVGYRVADLLGTITMYLSSSREWRLAIIGCGRLGNAIAWHICAGGGPYRLAAVFDCVPQKIGDRAGGVEILSSERIPAIARERNIDIAIVATPPRAAQGVVDLAVAGGIRLVLNFSPVALTVPDWVTVRTVDVANELFALSLRVPTRSRSRRRRPSPPAASWVTL